MISPVFAHGNLRLYLLALLAEQPRHGYELIQALGERFGGTYSPSAGTIYPRLAKLENEALVTKTHDGRRSVYSINDARRPPLTPPNNELPTRESELDDIETGVTDSVHRLAHSVRAEVKEAMRSLRAELASAARTAQHTAATTPTADPRGAGGDSPGRTESLRAVREADLVLNTFRRELGVALREHVRIHPVEQSTVTLLEKRLADVRAEILATLSR